MLNRNYQKRITIKEVMEHKWMKKQCGKIRVGKKKATRVLTNLEKY